MVRNSRRSDKMPDNPAGTLMACQYKNEHTPNMDEANFPRGSAWV
jgi:hypothetical protein